MILKTIEEIKAARERLPTGLLKDTSDLIAFHILEYPDDWPKTDEQAWMLFGLAVMRAQEVYLGQEGLTKEQAADVIESTKPYAKDTIILGLSGAVWMLNTSQKIDTGVKWAGRAALVGLGALLGFGIG